MAGHQAGIDPGPHLWEGFSLLPQPRSALYKSGICFLDIKVKLLLRILDKNIYIFSKFQCLCSF